MAESNNILLVLTILLLLVSLFGAFALLNNVAFETVPARAPSAVQKGEIGLSVLPGPGSDSTTGDIGFFVLPGG